MIEIRGICQENVRIEGRGVTLHGLDPANDGIQGVAATPPVAAFEIHYAEDVRVENLSIGNGPSGGVTMRFSRVIMEDCEMEGNALAGVFVGTSSSLVASGLEMSGNGTQGLVAAGGSSVFCERCVLENNTGFQAVAGTGGAIVSLLDSTVTGARGIQASFEGAYIDIDCVSVPAPDPCSLNATTRAAFALAGGIAALFGAGDFTGRVDAFDRAHILFLAARQQSTGTNNINGFATLDVQPFEDESAVLHPSQLRGTTNAGHFGRVVLGDTTVLDGTLNCSSAADAWADPGVVLTPGSSINGCEHVP